jgi:DNA-damage-inducible protein D
MSQHESPFDAIKRLTDRGIEYWSARDLYKLLGYKKWDNFLPAIKKAQDACRESGQAVSDHFPPSRNVITAGKGARHVVDDLALSRYACYLIVQNADPAKPIVALGQTYFAVQTRKQELAEQLAGLDEDQKRLIYRNEMAIFNRQLAETAQMAGVIEAWDFAIFTDHGYRGLYDGEGAADIAARKGLRPGEAVLDFMGSEELGANIFRATQTDAKIKRERITNKDAANRTHHEMGRKVRRFIADVGGEMPENLPTPAESIAELERKERKRLKRKPD